MALPPYLSPGSDLPANPPVGAPLPEETPRRAPSFLTVVVVAVVAALAGGTVAWLLHDDADAPSRTAAASTTTTAPAPVTTGAVGEVGRAIRVGTWSFDVVDFGEVDELDGDRPAKGTHWLTVRVDVTNRGTKAQRFAADYVVLAYLVADGPDRDTDVDYLQRGPDVGFTHNVPAGGEITQWLAFVVPDDANGYRLALAADAATINLSCC